MGRSHTRQAKARRKKLNKAAQHRGAALQRERNERQAERSTAWRSAR